MTAVLAFSGQLKAQDSFFLQMAFKSCLDHGEVQPHLKAVSFDDHREVLAVLKNKYVTSEMKLTQFGKKAVISPGPDLFFHGIEDYVRLSAVSIKKDKITLAFSAGANFTCA